MNTLQLFLLSLSDTNFRKNYLNFIRFNYTFNYVANNLSFYIESFYVDVSQSLLDENLLKHTQTIILDGVHVLIEEDTFKELKNLKELYIKNMRLRSLIHKSIDWINRLNFYDSVSYVIMIFLIKSSDYDFPDVDICLFKDIMFKERSLIIGFDDVYNFISLYKSNFSCSCTKLFFLQNINEKI